MKSELPDAQNTQMPKSNKQIKIKKNNKSAHNMWFVFKKYRFFIISLFIIVFVSMICGAFVSMNSSYIVVSFPFSEITQGHNPDGSPFDIYELLNDSVLSRACEKLDNKMDPDTLKKHIALSSNSSVGSFNSIQEKVMDGNNDYYYFPNRYMITYYVLSNKIAHEGIAASFKAIIDSFRMPAKKDVLVAVAQAYSEEYEQLHILKEDFFVVDWDYTQSLDHFNRISELQRIVEKMSRYVNEKYDENVQYVSKNGVSFGDLSAQLSSIRNIDMENYKAYVIQNCITQDKDKLLKQLRYVANNNTNIYNRKMAEYNVMLEGISMYDPNITKITFIPSLDVDDEFYMNRTKIGIDYLTRNADAAKLEAEEANNTAQYYSYLEKQFSAAPESDSKDVIQADEMCSQIIDKIDEFCEQAKIVNDEYIKNVSYEEIMITGVVNGKDMLYLCILISKIAIFSAAALYVLYCLSKFFEKVLKKNRINKKKVKQTGDYTEFV